MTVKDLYAALEARIPRALSCEWDNDGLMCCPDAEKTVERVLVALDITAEVVKQAIEGGYDLIVSHHPLVFRPLKSVNPLDAVANKVIRLLCAGVSAMSFHTRLDAVSGGVNDALANSLGLREVTPFGNEGEEIGRIGFLERKMTVKEFAEAVKTATGAPAVTVSDGGVDVYRVAVLGGSGSDDVLAARAAGADTYLSGELGHHFLTDCPEWHMNLVAAGHFYTENLVCRVLKEMLLEIDPSLRVTISNSNRVQIL